MAIEDFPRSRTGRSSLPPIEPAVLVLTGVAVLMVVLAWRRGNVDANDLVYFALLIPSIIVHEVSHGVAALAFGDHTAQRAGRLTLNPLRHVDPWGTFIIPALLLLSAGVAFGYAKPVPVNTTGMTRNQALATSLAGPGVNVVLALLAAGAIHLAVDASAGDVVLTLLVQLGLANVVLAAFNLIPLPPLDGSAVIERFLPDRYRMAWFMFRRYSMFVLLGVMLIFRGALSFVFDPALRLWVGLLP